MHINDNDTLADQDNTKMYPLNEQTAPILDSSYPTGGNP